MRSSLTCIVHQNMNRTEAGARCVKGAMEFLRFADIRLHVMELRIVSESVEGFRAAAKHGNVRAVSNQRTRHRRANTTRAASDYSMLASQSL